MKIGVVHWAFPPVVGGVESHLIYLYEELARMGHEVSFLTAPHPQRDDNSQEWCKITSNSLMSIEHLLPIPAGAERWQKVFEMMEATYGTNRPTSSMPITCTTSSPTMRRAWASFPGNTAFLSF